MFEEFIKKAFANAAQEIEQRREREFNELMSEIEAFHFRNAIEASLENNDRVSFMQLTGGEQ